MIKCTSLEVTGNLLEVPPAREPNSSRKRPSMPAIIDSNSPSSSSLNTRRKSSLTPGTNKPKAIQSSNQRSVSQLSTAKKNTVNSSTNTDSNYNEEDVQKLKRRIDELEVHLKMSQKLGKEREKQVDELNKKLNESINNGFTTNQKLGESLKLIESLRLENESLSKQLFNSQDQHQIELSRLKLQVNTIQEDHELEMRKLKEEFSRESKIKEDKLENLKKQIAGAFKDNSWERQLQIEELSKELKRAQEECELIKHKLKGYKNKHSDSCPNCESMLGKLELKTHESREKEMFISELVGLMEKFQAQFNFQDEIAKLKPSNPSNSFVNQQLIEISSRLGAASNLDSSATKKLINRKDSLKFMNNSGTNNNNINYKK